MLPLARSSSHSSALQTMCRSRFCSSCTCCLFAASSAAFSVLSSPNATSCARSQSQSRGLHCGARWGHMFCTRPWCRGPSFPCRPFGGTGSCHSRVAFCLACGNEGRVGGALRCIHAVAAHCRPAASSRPSCDLPWKFTHAALRISPVVRHNVGPHVCGHLSASKCACIVLAQSWSNQSQGRSDEDCCAAVTSSCAEKVDLGCVHSMLQWPFRLLFLP